MKKTIFVLALLVIAAMALAACQPAAPEPEVIVETVVVEKEGETITETIIETVVVEKEGETVVETVEVVVEVTPEPVVRQGGWLDRVVFSADGSVDSAVARLIAGDIDVYGQSSSNGEAYATAVDAGLATVQVATSYNDLTFNPYGPVFEESTGGLNPFAIREVRNAMNWLLDRDYIAQEIMSGLARPKLFSHNTVFSDYANNAAKARELEAQYPYDPEKAETIISEQMEALGATKNADGLWEYNGEPVTLIILIRTEDERRQIGDYVANQLESIGFTVDRQYKTSSEASVLWVRGNVADGLWHLYTGGWIGSVISRDDAWMPQFFYSPKSAYGFTSLWQNYEITDEADAVFEALANSEFGSVEERNGLIQECMEWGLYHSNRIWLVDRAGFMPYSPNVSVSADLAGGLTGTLMPYTLRFADQVGGEMKFVQADMFVEPWNPQAGSNWFYDATPQRMTQDAGILYDPFTGLVWPQRIEKAELVAEEGLPIGASLDWITLEFAPEVVVPEDAWSDWDAVNEVFITAGERFTETETANIKSTVYYEEDMFDKMVWHDGSPMSAADFVMVMIHAFVQGKADSPMFDEAQAGNVESFLSEFKGVRIASEDPLVIETWRDGYVLDAELSITTWWPEYGYGNGAWHTMAVGNLAEVSGELAYSADKADLNEVEQTSFIAGPSLEILKAKLDEAAAASHIPFEPTMGAFVTADDAAARYANLADWYSVNGHFWVGVGPYFLEKVFPVEKTLVVSRYQNYPDPADKWAIFAEPRVAAAEVDGPGRVTSGEEAVFDVFVTFKDEAYPAADINSVTYLVFDATGALAAQGDAELVEDGYYAVTLTAEQTAAMESGSNKLEVVVVSKVVSIPTFANFEFVTAAE
jgi:peptide/nickel transport system substrate-binding protein